MEEGWTGPADIAIGAQQFMDRHWGILVEPKSTVVIGPQTGHFAEDDTAILRVYRGNPTIAELLAYSRNDPERVDVYLAPGPSSYVIEWRANRLVATPREAPRTPPATNP